MQGRRRGEDGCDEIRRSIAKYQFIPEKLILLQCVCDMLSPPPTSDAPYKCLSLDILNRLNRRLRNIQAEEISQVHKCNNGSINNNNENIIH